MASQGTKPGQKRIAKVSEAQERLSKVDYLLRQCLTHSAILSVLTKEWGIGRRQVRNYIREVYKRWEAESPPVAERVVQRRGQVEGILEAAMRKTVMVDGVQVPAPELKVACHAAALLCKIDGCFAPVKVDATVTNPELEAKVEQMTTDEQRDRLEELMDMARHQSGVPSNGHGGEHSN